MRFVQFEFSSGLVVLVWPKLNLVRCIVPHGQQSAEYTVAEFITILRRVKKWKLAQ
jgi:hypothetical protein